MLDTIHLSIPITGANGSAASPAVAHGAVNVTTKPIRGAIETIAVAYNTQPNTTDIVVETYGDNQPKQTLLTLTNKNTDALFYPRTALHDTSGAAVTFDGTHAQLDNLVVNDYIDVTIAQGNAGTVDVYITYDADAE